MRVRRNGAVVRRAEQANEKRSMGVVVRCWVVCLVAWSLSGLTAGCTRAGPPTQEQPLEAIQQVAPPPPSSDVHCALSVDRDLLPPGTAIGLSAQLTPVRAALVDVRAFIVGPDGARTEAARWQGQQLEARALKQLDASWTVPADAKVGTYGVSLAVTSAQGVATETGNIASFRVDPNASVELPSNTARGIAISGRHLVDGRGRVFVPRGPELVVADERQAGEIDAIAATGANAMRMLLTIDTANGMTPLAFERLIARAVSHKMVVWISLFTWNDRHGRDIAPAFGGGRLAQMSDYLTVWERPWLKELVKKFDGWVIIDAMQEFKSKIQPPENSRAVREWVDAAKSHVRFFRRQGYKQPLQIMTSFEGRDLHAIIEHADEILGADDLTLHGSKQTLFGWQAYWGPGFYENWQGKALVGRRITAAEAVQKFVATRRYPIMVGLDTVDVPGRESYAEIMPACEAHSVGWLWWEWEELKTEPHGEIVRKSKAGFAGSGRASM